MNGDDNPFWRFSLALYERPGAAEACLWLQDEAGLDVNLLLFCCWAGAAGDTLRGHQMARAAALAEPWREAVVAPLRAVRRHLKPLAGEPGVAELRADVQKTELSAERLLQDRLHAAFPAVGGGEPSLAAAAENLTLYARLSGGGLPSGASRRLAALLGAAFPEAAEADIVTLLPTPDDNGS